MAPCAPQAFGSATHAPAQARAQRLHAAASSPAGAVSQEELRRKAVQAALDLQQKGWAVVEGVLPEEECTAYINGFWDWMASLGTGVLRDEPDSWKAPAWPPSYRGIINSCEVAHQAFVWRVRKHPRLLQVFEELWGSAALLSSFDSINALPPTASPPRRAWLHVDQAPWRRGAVCVQGLVNLVPVSGDTTGTLLVKSRTHTQHEPFFTRVSKMPPEQQRATGDHYAFSEAELAHWDAFESVAVAGGPGSLFLWDSRVVHANKFPARTSAFRHVVYACYQPAVMASKADLAEKRRAWEEHGLTTHWAAQNVRRYEKEQATAYYGAEAASRLPEYRLQRTRAQVEDRRLRQLAGVEPYGPNEARERRPLIGRSEAELAALLA